MNLKIVKKIFGAHIIKFSLSATLILKTVSMDGWISFLEEVIILYHIFKTVRDDFVGYVST